MINFSVIRLDTDFDGEGESDISLSEKVQQKASFHFVKSECMFIFLNLH